jgi:hypothetical protein
LDLSLRQCSNVLSSDGLKEALAQEPNADKQSRAYRQHERSRHCRKRASNASPRLSAFFGTLSIIYCAGTGITQRLVGTDDLLEVLLRPLITAVQIWVVGLC